MTILLFLLLLTSLTSYAQETTSSEDVMLDPSSEVVDPVSTTDGTADTVTPFAAPADAVVSEPVPATTETAAISEEGPAAVEVVPAPPKESVPVAETPNVTTPEEASPVTVDASKAETPVMSMELNADDEKFNPRKSHWLTTFGFEGLKYDVPWDYSGEEKNFKPSEQELWGGRLGFGGEIHLGAGIMATTRVEGYYLGTLFNRVLNAGPTDEDEEFAYSKRTGQVYGVDVTQALGFMFDFKTRNPFMDEWAYLTVEPFVEAGLGAARAYARVNYDYNTGATTNEGYRSRINDKLTNARFGGGINFTSSEGYFLYIKAIVNTYDITERRTDTVQRPDQGASTSTSVTEKNVKIDPITTYAIGGGYKF